MLFSKLIGVCGLLAVFAVIALHIKEVQSAPPSKPPDWTPEMRLAIFWLAVVIAVALVWNSWARFMAWWNHG